ncbi:hypothetical protein SAMN05216241_102438 [Limimonas halophila]|uniref:DUF86 domain-containing protein n=1 Tax=Limimonas halophila TaxID=1082479 RepID=A0A1G7P556_9PROT|nr:hypothetical protein [Limimonas halophila]SDF81466.1 hypothetical protein SAMN05216241_102438 [Limimonas halophila]
MTESPAERLVRALDLAEREETALVDARDRLFPEGAPVTPAWLRGIADSPARGDLVEAFAARFGRFQDGLGTKVLPLLLAALGERVGPLLDNLDRAHRFGWVDDPDAWMTARGLRNRLVHEYVDDPDDLADALNMAGHYVPALTAAHARMAEAARRRGIV